MTLKSLPQLQPNKNNNNNSKKKPGAGFNSQLRQIRLLRTLSLVLIVALAQGAAVVAAVTVFTGQLLFLLGPGLASLGMLAGTVGAYLMAGSGVKKAEKAPSYYSSAARLLVYPLSGGLMTDWFFLGSDAPLALLLVVALVLALLLLPTKDVIVVSTVSTVFGVALYLTHHLFKVYSPPIVLEADIIALFGVPTMLIGLPVLTLLFIIPIRNWTALVEAQAGQLGAALTRLQDRYDANHAIGHLSLSLASRLSRTAQQQATDAAQQASTATELGVIITELNQTASSIAIQVSQTAQLAAIVASSSQQIDETALAAVTQSEIGQAVIGRTLTLSYEVAELYQTLMAAMAEQTAQSANLRRILELVANFATTTRYLAISAAVEAAGGGSETKNGGAHWQRERFKEVSRAVKELAARSAEANAEVVKIVTESAKATQQAHQTALSGYALAQALASETTQAGRALTTTWEAIAHSQQQARKISEAANSVQSLMSLIELSTHQHQSASQHLLVAISQLIENAQAGASASQEVAEAANNLETVAHGLAQTPPLSEGGEGAGRGNDYQRSKTEAVGEKNEASGRKRKRSILGFSRG